jgi:hypothetical protein
MHETPIVFQKQAFRWHDNMLKDLNGLRAGFWSTLVKILLAYKMKRPPLSPERPVKVRGPKAATYSIVNQLTGGGGGS